MVAVTVRSSGSISTQARQFEILAARAMSNHFGVALTAGRAAAVPKKFDLVSADGSIVGDAKFYTLVGGRRLPPAKFATIAEHVWLLEKTTASHKFLVFGNQRDVPVSWLRRYGRLLSGVEFFFLSASGQLERLDS